MLKRYLTFLLKGFLSVVGFLLVSFSLLGCFFDEIKVLDKLVLILHIGLVLTVMAAVISSKDFLFSFDDKGIISGFLRTRTSWRDIKSLKVVSAFGISWTRLIIFSTEEEELTCKVSFVGTPDEIFSLLKRNLSWISDDVDLTREHYVEIKK